MKNNIIFLYITYVVALCLLLIIDTTVLMYYIFWVNNIFICPLIWLWVKIMYYNRTVLLLLLFYYFIAKFTIKELGYKYFRFFNIDIRKWRLIYLNYIWNITTYHIEIVSIFLFFFVIITPLILHNKDIIFLICYVIIFLFIWWRLLRHKLKYIKQKKIRIRSFLFFSFFIIVFLKVFNYQYIKDFYTMYVYLDKWVFELLEWKIQMYDKIMEKDYYSDTVGLKPIWIAEKLNKKEAIDNKLWENLYKKKKFNLLKELKYKWKRTERKYYLYFKYYERVFEVKNGQSLKKLEILREDLSSKKFVTINKYNNVVIKDYIPRKDITNENPVVTQEKEKERALHHTVISSIIHKFSLNNYYRLNLLLKDLTFNQLYYQPFIDKKGLEKQKIEEKREFLFLNVKENISIKEQLHIFKKIIEKIKKSEIYLNKLKKQPSYKFKNYNEDNFIFHKMLNYLIIEEKKKDFTKSFLKLFKMEDKKMNKKKKLNMEKFLKDIKIDIKKKEKINKLSFFSESKNNILNKDSLGKKRSLFYSFPVYVEKNELEKTDNQLLFNTVKKYNEEKTKANWKNEFNDFFVLKEKKENLTVSDTPDLSRRNKK